MDADIFTKPEVKEEVKTEIAEEAKSPTAAPGAVGGGEPEDQTPKLSKNQLKKLAKKEKWQSVKIERRQQERQKRKQKLAEKRERGEDTGPPRKRLKANKMENSSCKIKVAIDLSLDQYMDDKDIQSMADQLRHCYSTNRRATNPMQLYFSGSGKTKQRIDEIGDIKGWDVHEESAPYHEAFPKDSIVYLSSDSPNMLTTLSEDKVYIIGGLVDHNRHKGLCQRLAVERGVATAQLPIGEYFQMSTRKVLAVNHVYNILVKFTELNDWKQAFLTEMPQRKVESLKEKKPSGNTDNYNNKAVATPDAGTLADGETEADGERESEEEKQSDGEQKSDEEKDNENSTTHRVENDKDSLCKESKPDSSKS